MAKEDLLVKRANVAKFNHYTMYPWIHSESYNPFERFLMRNVLKNYSAKGKFAIDIGCGPGLVLEEMHRFYDYCVGIDISPGMLREAKNRLKAKEKLNVDVLCADIEYMPFRNSVFDAATMYSVLHHLPNINGSLKQINRIMTSKSSLILFHEPREMRIRKILEKTLIRMLGKGRAVLLRSVHRRKWLQVRQEAQHRSKKLGKLENFADIHSKKGFSNVGIRMLLEESGFDVIRIKTRIQSFMTAFSQLSWPYKSIAILDFVLSKVPVLNNYLPLLLCIAERKKSDSMGLD